MLKQDTMWFYVIPDLAIIVFTRFMFHSGVTKQCHRSMSCNSNCNEKLNMKYHIFISVQGIIITSTSMVKDAKTMYISKKAMESLWYAEQNNMKCRSRLVIGTKLETFIWCSSPIWGYVTGMCQYREATSVQQISSNKSISHTANSYNL